MNTPQPYTYLAKLVRLIDADTVELDVDLGFKVYHRIIVRLDRLNAPERSNPNHKAAFQWLQTQLYGNGPLRIVTRKDKQEKYGRYLAEIYYSTDTVSINQQMLDNGYAVPYSGGKR